MPWMTAILFLRAYWNQDHQALLQRATLFMPIRFMPTDSCPLIHTHFFHARSYSCPTDSCPEWPIHARAYSCPDLFMPYKTDSCPYLFMPRLVHALNSKKMYSNTYSCRIIFITGTFHAHCDFFMSEPIHAHTYSCPLLNHNIAKPHSRIWLGSRAQLGYVKLG